MLELQATQKKKAVSQAKVYDQKGWVAARGGGLTSIIKVYTDVRLEGVYFSGLQVYDWVSFSHQKYINGVSFSPKKYMNE